MHTDLQAQLQRVCRLHPRPAAAELAVLGTDERARRLRGIAQQQQQ